MCVPQKKQARLRDIVSTTGPDRHQACNLPWPVKASKGPHSSGKHELVPKF